jgi:hypothetical protein
MGALPTSRPPWASAGARSTGASMSLRQCGRATRRIPNAPAAGRGVSAAPGGGRPKKSEQTPGLEEALEEVLQAHSAGRPTDPTVVWTDLKPAPLAAELTARGFALCPNTAADLLDEAGFRRRALAKELPCAADDRAQRAVQPHRRGAPGGTRPRHPGVQCRHQEKGAARDTLPPGSVLQQRRSVRLRSRLPPLGRGRADPPRGRRRL